MGQGTCRSSAVFCWKLLSNPSHKVLRGAEAGRQSSVVSSVPKEAEMTVAGYGTLDERGLGLKAGLEGWG